MEDIESESIYMSSPREEEQPMEAVNNSVEFVDGDPNDDKITSTEIMAKGISSMISSVIRDFDASATATCHSQNHLFSALDRLSSELDQLLEDAPLPFIMQHASKLSNVTKRVSSLNSVLRSIQRRLDNIDRMLSVTIPNDQTNVGGSE